MINTNQYTRANGMSDRFPQEAQINVCKLEPSQIANNTKLQGLKVTKIGTNCNSNYICEFGRGAGYWSSGPRIHQSPPPDGGHVNGRRAGSQATKQDKNAPTKGPAGAPGPVPLQCVMDHKTQKWTEPIVPYLCPTKWQKEVPITMDHSVQQI